MVEEYMGKKESTGLIDYIVGLVLGILMGGVGGIFFIGSQLCSFLACCYNRIIYEQEIHAGLRGRVYCEPSDMPITGLRLICSPSVIDCA